MPSAAKLEFACASCGLIVRMNSARYEFDPALIKTRIFPHDASRKPVLMDVKRELETPCPQCSGALALACAFPSDDDPLV